MKNVITVKPRTGEFAGQTVSTNIEQYGIFTWEKDGTLLQHTGTGQTPKFRDARHLSSWLKKHF